MKTTMVLSMSSPSLDCAELMQKMRSAGISCGVSPNHTVVDGQIERGCRITTTVESRKQVRGIWDTARRGEDVKCAHLHLQGSYSGCVLDYSFESKCK